jgi:glycerol-3-phosphate acyltransferase PlsY
MFGHAFSPFLGFRGGKSLAVTFGAWTGLTLAEIPLVLGISFAIWLFLLSSESWAVMAGMLTTLGYILAWSFNPVWLVVWAGSFALLMWKHRDGFRKRPHLPRLRSSSRRKGTEGRLPGV